MINLPPCIVTSPYISQRKEGKYQIVLLFPKKWQNEWISYLKERCGDALVDETLVDKPSLFPVQEGWAIKCPTYRLQTLYRKCYVIKLTSEEQPTVVDRTGAQVDQSSIKSMDTVSVNIEIENTDDVLSFKWVATQWLGTPKKGEGIVGTKTLLELASGHPDLDITLNYPVPGYRVIPHTSILYNKQERKKKFSDVSEKQMKDREKARRRLEYLKGKNDLDSLINL